MTWRALVVAIVSVAACGDNHHHGGGELVVSPTADLHTSEAGGTATVTIALTEPPEGRVDVTLATSNDHEGVVAPSALVFTPGDFDRPQRVVVAGVDDPWVDGPQRYTIQISASGSVLPIAAVDLEVTNDDDDHAGAIVTPVTGLLTSETGTHATFTVRLTAKPMYDVMIPIASSRPSEGIADRTSLTFTPNNWDLAQTVTVTGVDDQIADGVQPYTIVLAPATSDDPAFAGLDADDVQAMNVDDDLQAIVVTPTSGLVTTEAGGSDHFAVVLATQPTAAVTIALSSSAPGEARASTGALVFTPATWSTPQLVTVTGIDDPIVDGDRTWTIVLAPAVTTDPRYGGLDPDDVTGTNVDDDTPGIDASPASGLVTSERGTTDHFRVVLHSEPVATVTVHVTSSDTTEGTVYPASIVFTPATWNVAQTITVRGVNDSLVDGDIAYQVDLVATSADPVYANLVGDPVSVTNLDNDRAGFVITPPGNLVVSEFGDSATFTIALLKRPTATVRLTLASSDLTEGFVAPAALTFTPGTWTVPRTVTVTGVDDLLSDGNQPFLIITGAATSSDPAYAGIDPPDVTVTNIDNETPQVYVKAKPLVTTSENGAKATYQMRLTVAPVASVVCPITSNDPTEGIANPAGVTFTPGSYGFQTVTITGIDDAIPDGDQLYDVLDTACSSSDPAYAGADPSDVHAVNLDND
ncbi:MAG: Calx-beta domain-containing protein [Kofleriaceae bacterium]